MWKEWERFAEELEKCGFEKQEKDSMPQKANCLKLFTRRFVIDLNTEWKYLCSGKPSDSSMLFA